MAATQKRKKRRNKKHFNPIPLIIVAVALIAIIVLVAVILSKKFAPSKEQQDLQAYFFLTEDADTGRTAATEDELAIVLEDTMLDDVRGISQNGEAYVPVTLVRDNIDDRFYWDSNENILSVTNATQIITASADKAQYSINGDSVSTDAPVAIVRDGTAYVSATFMDQYSSAESRVYTDPNRIYIEYVTGDKNVCTVRSDTQIRVRGGVKSNIVTEVEKDETLQIIEDLDDWLEVVNEEGFVGYIKTSKVKDVRTETFVSGYVEPEYTHLSTGAPVSMAWNAVYNDGANSSLSELTASCQGLTVVSPTWYRLSGTSGQFDNFSGSAYIATAHSKGYLVWAMLTNEYDADYAHGAMAQTSVRTNLIDAVIGDIVSMGIDGLNVDFESFYSEDGWDYLEFLRELSVKCRAQGIYFSVCCPPPYSFNDCYHFSDQNDLCDYMVVMAYDDYLGTDEAGPNAGLPYVQEVLSMVEEQADMSRVIMGVPFYSRFWIYDGSLSRQEYGMSDTQDIVSSHDAEVKWDAETGYRYAAYTANGKTVQVWIEDSASIEAKLQLFSQYNVAGAAFWRLGQETDDVWDVIGSYY